MKLKAKYKDKVVYIIGFAGGSGCAGIPRSKAIICYDFFGRIKEVDLYELYIIDEDNPFKK